MFKISGLDQLTRQLEQAQQAFAEIDGELGTVEFNPHDPASIEAASQVLAKAGLPARLMVDASHANSGKDPDNQPAVIDDIAAQLEAGERRIVGVMVESHLVGGRQDLVDGQPLRYGQSITDGCLGWEASVQGLQRLAEAVRIRRLAKAA